MWAANSRDNQREEDAMAKRISDRMRLVSFALVVDKDELASLIETLIAIRDNRFPTGVKLRKVRAKVEKEESLSLTGKGVTVNSPIRGTAAGQG